MQDLSSMNYFVAIFSHKNTLLLLLIAAVSIIGDYIVVHTKIHLFQALFDTATHGVIGGLSWAFVCLNCRPQSPTQSLLEIALCTAIASLIDVDHFIAAKSLSLKDATNLHSRPPLHCSTFPLAICVSILVISHNWQSDTWKRGALIVFTAFLSHHTRDATRRGFWLYPFGHTPPIPYFSYVIITCLIPYAIVVLHEYCATEELNKQAII